MASPDQAQTPLMRALDRGRSVELQEIESIFAQDPLTLNAQDEDGWTALMYACRYAHPQAANFLIRNHAKTNIQSRDGFTAIMLAARSGQHEIVTLLEKNDADLSMRTKNGYSALMLASCAPLEKNHKAEDLAKCVKVCWASGADTNLREANDFDALELAQHHGCKEVVSFLTFLNDLETDLAAAIGSTLPRSAIVCLYEHDVLTRGHCRELVREDLERFGMESDHIQILLSHFPPTPNGRSRNGSSIRSSLWRLTMLRQAVRSIEVYDAFLSHNWGMNQETHELVRKINDRLKKKKVKTWFDGDELEHSLSRQMSAGIDASHVFIVFVTERYMLKLMRSERLPRSPCSTGSNDSVATEQSDASSSTDGTSPSEGSYSAREFAYAISRRKTVIPVVLEPSMLPGGEMWPWQGPLNFDLGDPVIVDFSTPAQQKSNLKYLVERIKSACP